MSDAGREPLWTPPPDRVARANLTAFSAAVRHDYAADVGDYRSLYRWSITSPDRFCPAVWPRWFPGARLNFAENLLRRRDAHPALVACNESGRRRELSYAELYDEAGRVATALEAAGVRPGDRVAAFMPNVPETVIAMLAATSLGAVWSSCSPDFGVAGVVDRFGQIAPRILFCADGYRYGGKEIDCLGRVADITRRIPAIEQVVVVPYLAERPPIRTIPGGVLWD